MNGATAAVSGGAMAYVDEGEGPPVVLLHGFPTSSFLWRREIPLLASRMRVIAPDMLGYGRRRGSGGPQRRVVIEQKTPNDRDALARLAFDGCREFRRLRQFLETAPIISARRAHRWHTPQSDNVSE